MKATGIVRRIDDLGRVVIPKEIEFSGIIPIQYPADDTSAKWRTTHFDYHKFESNLLKEQ